MSLSRPLRLVFSPHRILQTSARRTFISTHNRKNIVSANQTSNSTHPKMATTDPVLPGGVPAPPTVDPSTKPKPEEAPLPKLSQHDFRIYNRMAEHMDYFHSHFRETWNVLYGTCESGKRSKGMSIRQFIALGQQFCGQLEMHHGIEERYVTFRHHVI